MIDRILIIGATSAIAHAVARRYASRGARLFLIARRPDVLEANAADLRVRGAREVRTALLDANNVERHTNVLDEGFAAFGGFDATLVAHGTLPDQAECERSVDATLASFDTNARSTIALLTILANRFEAQGKGVIGVISSPAGDRGRASNYVYGAAKAALSNFASGLRHRLFSKGVRVITILPGFVDTPMTTKFEKGPFWVGTERIAVDVERALERGSGVVYMPWFWRWIMLLIRHLPEQIFIRTRL
ncbi:MAG TPA: SDR family oxidoreductase [Burkholderiales bacterium]|nr:SDR family oxidoreductase [Burkholderiales bacterium]